MILQRKHSLHLILGVIIISVVSGIMFLHAAYRYEHTKNKMIQELKHASKLTIESLQKHMTDLVASYSLHEYDKLILNEIEVRDNFAIIVEDYKMGEVLGGGAYISGKIRNEAWQVVDYDPANPEHAKKLQEAYDVAKHEIVTRLGEKAGMLWVYSSDRFIKKELRNIVTSTLVDTFFILLFLFFVLYFAIRLYILKPLSNIIGVLSDSDEDGIPLRQITQTQGSKEISALANTVNTMIETIKKSRITLTKQHQQLLSQKEVLAYQAHYDFLTGLPNRILFNDRLEHAIEKAHVSGKKVALLFIDLDHFKEINDSLGHDFGDKLLQKVTAQFQGIMGANNTLSRLGGDEFTVILEELQKAEEASHVAQLLIDLFAEPLFIEEKRLYVSCSIGISIYPDDGKDARNLFQYADAAMYKAKEEGRNNFQYYSAEMTELSLQKIVVETNLREGLKKGELVVYYQPQINAKTGVVSGMEALVRWQSPLFGLISPASFLPVAEASGLIIELDRFVMQSALTQIAKWRKEGLDTGVLAMNLTVKQLQQKDFLSYLQTLMQETGCDPKYLELEVTEGQIMTRPEEAIRILGEINQLGIRLSVDDFGTGYSSLSYLKKLPIHKLKIDQSFIKELPYDEEDVAITRAVIALAKSLNLNIIAEGVETLEQQEFLVRNGCEHIQGYFYAKPMPADEVEIFLKKQHRRDD